MTAACANGNLSFFIYSPNVTEDPTIVRRLAFADRLEDRSISRGHKFADVFSHIARVGHEAAEANWDGEGAPAISAEAISGAIQIAAHLPTSWPAPEVSADPDGGISFEWYKDQGHM